MLKTKVQIWKKMFKLGFFRKPDGTKKYAKNQPNQEN
jgi:hypothetical protein